MTSGSGSGGPTQARADRALKHGAEVVQGAGEGGELFEGGQGMLGTGRVYALVQFEAYEARGDGCGEAGGIDELCERGFREHAGEYELEFLDPAGHALGGRGGESGLGLGAREKLAEYGEVACRLLLRVQVAGDVEELAQAADLG